MKKTNILYTIWSLQYGGAERFVLNLISKLDKNKYNIYIFSDNSKMGPLQEKFEKNGAKIIYSKYHRFKHPIKYKKQIAKVIVDNNIDIIHANDDLNMVFPIWANKHRAYFIAHSHNTEFRFTTNRIISRLATRIFTRYITKRADVRLGCSREAGRAMFGNKTFQAISNGIEVDVFKPSKNKRTEARKKFGIKPDETVLLNVGRLEKEKNQGYLVDVYVEYYKINPTSRLLIVGNGKEKETLTKKISESGISNRVKVISGEDDMADIYNAADIFVMPSLFEGMPLSSIEAQAGGLKCVFSDRITKEADHIGTATFLPLKLTPEQWAKKLAKMDTKRQCDYNTIKKYDISHIVSEFEKIYSEAYKNNNAQ